MTHEPTKVALAISTTGPDTERDELTAIAAVRFRGRDADTPLVVRLPRDASGLGAIRAYAEGATVVVHQSEIWWPFLARHGLLAEASRHDTAELAAILEPTTPTSDLPELCARRGIVTEGLLAGGDATGEGPTGGGAAGEGPTGGGAAGDGPIGGHRSDESATDEIGSATLARAEATRRLYASLAAEAARLDPAVLHAVRRMGVASGWSLAPLFAAAAVETSDAPPTRIPVPHRRIARPAPRAPADTRLDAESLEALIAPGGRLAASLDTYRDRPGQRQMLRLVADAFDLGDQLLVEAGTGTGKTLAYLLPAAAWAQQSGQPVVVATHTIALQDQILTKDAPTLRTLLDGDLRAAVLKGRSHYLCRTRLAGLATRGDLAAASVGTVARLLVWSATTETGDRSELDLAEEDRPVWAQVSADGDACTAQHCPHAAAGECWLHLARARAEAAHIVVVSHALLISDMMVANRVLPAYDRLIVDEAHHLEEVATTALGFTVSLRRLRRALRGLDAGERGLLPMLAREAAEASLLDTTTDWSPLRAAVDEARRRAAEAERRGARLFDALAQLALDRGAGGAAELRLTDALRRGEAWQRVEEERELVSAALKDLRGVLVRLSHAVTAAESHLGEGAALAADLATSLRELSDIDHGMSRAVSEPSAQDVVWTAGSGSRVSLHGCPLHVGDTLQQQLFAECETLVLTSATLRAGERFDYLRERLSVPDAPGEVVASPFDFDRAVLVAVPADVPSPGRPGYQRAVAQCVAALASALGGRVMVLYTSHSGLQDTYHRIRAPLGAAGVRVLGQGMDGSRRRLVQRFASPDQPTVLLGTRSFWEGVDIPGAALSCLVMARLPFDVPTDPVFAARSETFEDPFHDFALPRAVLRFRQGFGRLIRRETDRGAFVALDSRVLHKGYGRSFLGALPGGRPWTGPLHALPSVVQSFVDDGHAVAAEPRTTALELEDPDRGEGR